MKSVKIVLGIVVLCVCLCGCKNTDPRRDDERYKNDCEEMFEKVLAALDEEDADALKGLVSDNTVEHVEDLDEWIDELMEFYEGRSEEYQCSGGVEKGMITSFYEKEFIVTTDEDVYCISLGYMSHDPEFEKEHPHEISKNVGINSMIILKKDLKDEIGFTQWADGEGDFSIYYTVDDVPRD